MRPHPEPVIPAHPCGGEAVPDSGWPQWRGSDGMGVAHGSALPTRLAPDSPELLWRTEVPGEGISSPVVAEGHVFVTTAYPGELGGGLAALRLVVPVAALLVLALLVRGRKSGGTGLVARLDRLARLLGTLVFLAALNVAAFWSDLLWEPGSPGYRWFYSGAIALFGLAVAVGWFGPRSVLRLAGMAVVVAVGAWLYSRIPPNKYAEPFRASVRVAMLAPALAWCAWIALATWFSRDAPEDGERGALSTTGAAALVLAGGAMFALVNFLAPAAGLLRAVVCFDLESGRQLWNTPLFVAPEEKKYPKNSYATPTVCATPEVVFAHFGAGYAALDHSGAVLWKAVDPDFHEHTRYGASASPVLFEDSVIYQHDKEIGLGPSYAMRLRLADGEVLWRVESETNHDSYTTPLLVEREGQPELLTVTFDRLYARDPRSGQETWSLTIPIEQMVPGLQLRGDLLLASGGSHLKSSTSALRLTGSGAATQAEVVWQTRRAVPAIASPVLVEDCFLTITDGGILTCFDPEDGTQRWQERMPGAYWASLVAGDGKAYALNDEGVLTTLRVGHEYQELAQGDFASPCYATPAIAGGRVLVRTERALFCFGAR